MLTDLRIKNFALIDEAHIKFEPGLNIMTGETGAGKTIVLEAMNLLLGKRADPVLIGPAGDEALVEAVMKTDAGETVLSRSVTSSGKNKCLINGQLANLTMLTDITDGLVDFHGQHDHQALLRIATHLGYLDGFGGPVIAEKLNAYGGTYAEYREVEAELASVSAAERDRLGQLDLLRFQVDEIERSDLAPGEDEALEKELLVLRSSEKLAAAVDGASRALKGGDETGGAEAALDQAAKDLTKVSDIDTGLKTKSERLAELAIEAGELGRDLAAYRRDIVFDPARLEETASRLDLIKTLKKKYGETIEDVISFKDKAKQKLEEIDDFAGRLSGLNTRHDELEKELHGLGDELTGMRRKAAGQLEKTVEAELAGLNLKGCKFKVGFGETLELTPDGKDRIEFLLSPNIGQGLKPLAKVASGGEISRIMLALKIAFIKADPVDVLIFDEIDSGIGGETASAVGAKLKTLAAEHQVICITHLPQIAAYGDSHLFVSKAVKGGATVTGIKALDESGRVEELSRMLTGGRATAETSRQHARELMRAARG